MTDTNLRTDTSLRFSLEHAAVRGVFVNLSASCTAATNQAAYPPAVRQLLNEFIVTNAAIACLTRFDGTLTLQARSNTGLNLIMSDYRNGDIRAIAKGHERVVGHGLTELLPDGILALTMDPKVGERYQGVIGLERAHIADCVADYFSQSEQLKTSVHIYHTDHGIAALLLQAIPATEHNQLDDEQWETLNLLADTLQPEEIATLCNEDVLYRLFHEYGVRVFEAQSIRYHCGCSKAKMEQALASLRYEDLDEMLRLDGKIQLNCEFCGDHYDFYRTDIEPLFNKTPKFTEMNGVKKLH